MRLHLLTLSQKRRYLIKKQHFWDTFTPKKKKKKAVGSKKSTGLSTCDAELYKLYRVFLSWHIGSVWVRCGTWFIAAVIGAARRVISLAQFVSPHFLPLGRAAVFPAGCFIQGCVFLERYALGSQLSFCGREKGLSLLEWEWFYMFGLLLCMNGSQGLCVEKCTMPHHSCSEVILEDFGRWSGLFYKCWGGKCVRDTCTVWEKETLSPWSTKMNHSQRIKLNEF